MGRTTPTISMLMDQFENGVFGRFTKSATINERKIISSLFARARRHITAISMTGHMLPFEATLLAMQHEQQKQINELKEIILHKMK